MVERTAVPSPPTPTMDATQPSPPLLQATDVSHTHALSTPTWFQSPLPRVDPTTGNTYLAPLPVQMQRMVAELTDQADWYEGDTNTTPSGDPVPRSRQPATIDLTTPPSEHGHPSRVPATLDIRFRDADVTSPDLTAAGFTPAPSHRQPRGSTFSTPAHPRLHVLMESTLDTITEHARALEDAAMERHRIRMERSQDTLRAAIQDAVDHFRKETATMQTAHQSDLTTFREQQAQQVVDTREQHAAHLADIMAQVTSQMDELRLQVTSQMEDIRLQVSTRLYNGNLVTPSATSAAPDDPAPALPTGSHPNHQPPPQPPPPMPENTSTMPHPAPGGPAPPPKSRWSNVNLDFLHHGSERRSSECEQVPPPKPANGCHGNR